MLRLLERTGLLVAVSMGLAATTTAHAHFKLLQPPSWLKEDSAGGPQKGSPCGPGGSDNVNPTPTSGTVSTFHAGETITVSWVDTIAHPGHFRIALAANRDDLKDPDIQQDAFCTYDEDNVPMGAHGNVLADGLFFRSANGFNAPAGMMFTTTVTLPDTPCDKCTLQVMQVMENDLQALSNCYYHHCADLQILAKDDPTPDSDAGNIMVGDADDAGATAVSTSPDGDQGGSESTTTTRDASSGSASGGSSSTKKDAGSTKHDASTQDETTASSKSDSGCSVSVGSEGGTRGLATLLMTALGLLVVRRRRTA